MMPREDRRFARSRYLLRTSTRLGVEPLVTGHPTIYAEGGNLQVGDRFRFASTPVPSHLVAGEGATLQIGDDVRIGCGAAIAAHMQVSIGSGTRIGPFVIIMDTNFHGSAGDMSIQHDCRPVSIGKNCLIGTRVTITRGAVIGDGAEILAGSVVASTIPPGVCAAGAPARIIGKAHDPASRWDGLAAAMPQLLMQVLGLKAPPDLDDSPMPAGCWNDERWRQLLSAVEERIGVSLNLGFNPEMTSFQQLVAGVHAALAK